MESPLEDLFFQFEKETTSSMLQFVENINKRRERYFSDKQQMLNSRIQNAKRLQNRSRSKHNENSRFSDWTEEDSNVASASNSPQRPPCRRKQTTSTPKKGCNPQFHLEDNTDVSPISRKQERFPFFGQCPYCQGTLKIEPVEAPPQNTSINTSQSNNSNSTLYEARISMNSESQSQLTNGHWGEERCGENMTQQSQPSSHPPVTGSRGYFGGTTYPQNCCQPHHPPQIYHSYMVKEKLDYQQKKPELFGQLASEKKSFFTGGTGDANSNPTMTFKDMLKLYKEVEGSTGSNGTSQFSTQTSSANSIISPCPSENEYEVEPEPNHRQLTLEELDELLKTYSRY